MASRADAGRSRRPPRPAAGRARHRPPRVRALDYQALGEERLAAEAREERRLFYVAMTRARERLILSGAAKLDAWDAERSPMGWIAPAVEGAGVVARGVVADDGEPASVARDAAADDGEPASVAPVPAAPTPVLDHDGDLGSISTRSPWTPWPRRPDPRCRALSYSSLGDYERCGYRFYAERVLGLPPLPEPPAPRPSALESLSGIERGTLVHALLERLDFRRPVAPTEARSREAQRAPSAAEAKQIGALIERFAGSEICGRLSAATDVRREERFAFLLDEQVLVNGVLDVIAREPGGAMLVVDYKTDRLEGADPRELLESHYATQRLVYALAALRAGRRAGRGRALFLERPQRPGHGRFTRDQAPALERELTALAAGVLAREFTVTEAPHRGVCSGCPAEGGLCSWPLEMTRREASDRLF